MSTKFKLLILVIIITIMLLLATTYFFILNTPSVRALVLPQKQEQVDHTKDPIIVQDKSGTTTIEDVKKSYPDTDNITINYNMRNLDQMRQTTQGVNNDSTPTKGRKAFCDGEENNEKLPTCYNPKK